MIIKGVRKNCDQDQRCDVRINSLKTSKLFLIARSGEKAGKKKDTKYEG
jgi:hypothetical protein